MNEDLVQMSGTLRTNLETIKAYINLGLEKGGTDNIIIREACNNVYNYAMRLELKEIGIDMDINCLHSGYYWMSTKRFALWEKGGRRGGIREHVVPFRIIRNCIEEIIKENDNLCDIYNYLKEALKVVWITEAEEKALNDAGFRARVPENGKNRHEAVCIEWHNKPVMAWRVRRA